MSKKKRLGKPGDSKPADKSAFVPQRDKLKDGLSINPRYQWTDRQKELINLILGKDTKVVFVNGPAGTAKTLVGVYAGLALLNERKVSDMVFVRSLIESASRSMGALPGEAKDKFEPYAMPLNDKLSELLPPCDINRLYAEQRIQLVPINFVRGASYNVKYILSDESQNLDYKELTTLISRLGRFSKIVILGDAGQSDINGKSGFIKMFDLFNDEASRIQGIHCFSFTKDDIVRSGILRYIMERIEGTVPRESMFPSRV